jgi:hypothetical protein
LKLDLKKIKLKGLPNGLKLNLQDKLNLNLSSKDLKSTERSRKVKDWDSDSDLNSYRYNLKTDLKSNDGSSTTNYWMKIANFDKSYATKQTFAQSEAKSSARMKNDWTYNVPKVKVDQDSEDDNE